jgi:outer membrane immunogenic protein
MKRFVVAGLGALALISAVPASAADLPRSPYRAPAMVSPVYNWTGFYVGVHGGYAWGSSSGLNLDGGFIGGQLGYNWQGLGNPWVFGIEFDSAWADLGRTDTISSAAGTLSVESRANYMGSFRPRIGYAFDRTMLYVTGGLGWINNKVSVNATVGGFTAGISDTRTHFGGVIGGGIEHAFAPQLTGKLEYLYAGYNDQTYFGNIAGGVSANADVHTIKLGLYFQIR